MKILFLFMMLPLLSSWGFGVTNKNGNVDIGEYKEVLKRHNSYYIGKENNIYFTFDTGYETGNTSKILDTLNEKNVKATFFVTGHFMKTNPDLIKRMYEEGHIVGNHTWGHPKMTKISNEKLEEEINKLNMEYERITGSKMEKYFRPPCGDFDDRTLTKLDELGYKTVFWSLAYKDWVQNETKGKKYAYDSVMSKIHSGAIILLHTVSNDNKDALADIIDGCRNKGYNISNLDNL